MIIHINWKHGEIFEATAENGNKLMPDGDSAHAHGLARWKQC